MCRGAKGVGLKAAAKGGWGGGEGVQEGPKERWSTPPPPPPGGGPSSAGGVPSLRTTGGAMRSGRARAHGRTPWPGPPSPASCPGGRGVTPPAPRVPRDLSPHPLRQSTGTLSLRGAVAADKHRAFQCDRPGCFLRLVTGGDGRGNGWVQPARLGPAEARFFLIENCPRKVRGNDNSDATDTPRPPSAADLFTRTLSDQTVRSSGYENLPRRSAAIRFPPNPVRHAPPSPWHRFPSSSSPTGAPHLFLEPN